MCWKKLSAFCFLLVFYLNVFSQSISNEGRDFWVCFPSHIPSEINGGVIRYATMSVFITAKSNSSGVVSCGSFSRSFNVNANEVIEIEIPRVDSYVGDGKDSIAKNKGIHVVVNENQPNVVVYAHVFAGARSAASLVIPYEALGQKYFVMSYKGDEELGNYSQYNIIAVEPQTSIKITPMFNGIRQIPKLVYLEEAGDVYQYQNADDLTGTIIEVSENNPCKKIAVFSGSNSSIIVSADDNLDLRNASRDPLFQQLYPKESFGKIYSLIPFFNRNRGSIYKFLASENQTKVTYKGVEISLNEGESYTTFADNSVSILTSDKPISVAQYALTQLYSDTRNVSNNIAIVGDPDMVMLNPLEYSIDHITLYSSTKQDIEEQYLNVTIPTIGVSTFKMNAVSQETLFTRISGNQEYSYAQIDLTNKGTNFNLSSDVGFVATAYGFGNAESYAYSAGTSLASNKMVYPVNVNTSARLRDVCLDNTIDFELLLPYRSTKLIWKLEDEVEVVIENPAYEMIAGVNGDLYLYKFLANKTFTQGGNKSLTVRSVPPPAANICYVGEEDVVSILFNVADVPEISFNAPEKFCIKEAVPFNFNNHKSDIEVNSWEWDFGDGTYSTEQNPFHAFDNVGTYVVKLKAKSKDNCYSQIFEKTIEIIEVQMVSGFNVNDKLCTGIESYFENISISIDYPFTSYRWMVNEELVSTERNLKYVFTQAGTYKVELINVNSLGCSSNRIKQVEVIESPVLDFTYALGCFEDNIPFKANFSTNNFVSFIWDFGDNTPLVEGEEVQHKFRSEGIYSVKLIATTNTNCEIIILKEVRVNGNDQTSAFEILSGSTICRSQKVIIKNKSNYVDGIITKLEIVFNYQNIIIDKKTILNPIENDTYIYDLAVNNISSCDVSVIAYTGENCAIESSIESITIYPNSVLKYEALEGICINTPPFLLLTYNESELSGVATFTGNGISDSSIPMFNPAVAGEGIHRIKYHFLTKNGCEDEIEFDIEVKPIPLIANESQHIVFEILRDGEKQLDFSLAEFSNFDYEWLPAVGVSDPAILNPTLFPKESMNYQLTIKSGNECLIVYNIQVIVHDDTFVPNAFSPNGDGIHDQWQIKYLESFRNADVRIFNRYGQEVFISKGYESSWDGKFKGKDIPAGVYYYVIEPNNGRRKYTGSITLIR